MSYKLNPFTGTFDIVDSISALQAKLDDIYLKLDQTTVQKVINGLPQFNEGITIKADKPVYLDGI